MRLSRRALCAAALAGLAGCATVPTRGPVVEVPASSNQAQPGGVRIAPDPPAPGATRELILAGFLAACLDPTDGYAVARQYLAPSAAANWDPTRGVSVYDADGHPPVVTDTGALVRAPLLGKVSSEGFYTAVHEPDFSHLFSMGRVDNQWRILEPPEGLLVSRYQFVRAFQAQLVYFLDRLGQRVVAEEVYVPNLIASPTSAIQALLRGPSAWLRPAVLDVLPADVKLAAPAVTLSKDGIAEVSLTAPVESLSAEQRLQMSAQVLWTLSNFSHMSGVRITSSGNPLVFPNQDSDGVLRMSSVTGLAAVNPTPSRQIFGLADGVAVRLPDSAGGSTQPVVGPFGRPWGHTPGAMAVTPDGASVVMTTADGEQMYSAGVVDQEPRQRLQAQGLGRPQVDADGVVWVCAQTTAGPSLYQVTDSAAQRYPLTDLAGSRVLSLRISPDRTRVAVVVDQAGTRQFGLLRLRGTDALTVDGWMPVPLNATGGQLTDLRDVCWASATDVLLLGATTADPHLSVYQADVTGAQVAALGPVADTGAQSLAALPASTGLVSCLLTSDGRVLRYEDTSRWIEIGAGFSAVCYAG